MNPDPFKFFVQIKSASIFLRNLAVWIVRNGSENRHFMPLPNKVAGEFNKSSDGSPFGRKMLSYDQNLHVAIRANSG